MQQEYPTIKLSSGIKFDASHWRHEKCYIACKTSLYIKNYERRVESFPVALSPGRSDQFDFTAGASHLAQKTPLAAVRLKEEPSCWFSSNDSASLNGEVAVASRHSGRYLAGKIGRKSAKNSDEQA